MTGIRKVLIQFSISVTSVQAMGGSMSLLDSRVDQATVRDLIRIAQASRMIQLGAETHSSSCNETKV